MAVLPPRLQGLQVNLICECLDNFGDAGISWRLAKLLNQEWQAGVRLYIDQPELVKLWSEQDHARLTAGDLTPEVLDFAALETNPGKPADLVVAMLGSSVPTRLRQTLASGRPPWIRYEYLTAETWINDVHGLASLKPADGAREWFYYPGFSRTSGGLLREQDLIERLSTFAASDPANTSRRNQWLDANGLSSPARHWRVCLFGYPDQATADFLAALKALEQPLTVIMSQSLADGLSITPARWSTDSGKQLLIHRWLDQPGFDLLLSSCELNIVRGEDSWLRAQWAGKPMLWQPYRQADGAHLSKLHAYLERLLDGADPAIHQAVSQLMLSVNGAAEPSLALANWLDHLPAINDWHLNWRERLASQSSLTDRLAQFCMDHLQLRA